MAQNNVEFGGRMDDTWRVEKLKLVNFLYFYFLGNLHFNDHEILNEFDTYDMIYLRRI